MIRFQREPTLKEMLSDSIIQAVMEADGVDPRELAAMLRQKGGNSSRPRSGCHSISRPMLSRHTAE
jgi:carbamoylphosphate synthase small subunit